MTIIGALSAVCDWRFGFHQQGPMYSPIMIRLIGLSVAAPPGTCNKYRHVFRHLAARQAESTMLKALIEHV